LNQSQKCAFSASSDSSLVALCSSLPLSPCSLSRRVLSLSFPQTPSCQPPLERVVYSNRSPSTPQPGQSTLPSSFRRLPPSPPPMAVSAPQAAQISPSWPTAPHLASVWCCRSPLGSGAACPSPPPFSIPLLVTKGGCWSPSDSVPLFPFPKEMGPLLAPRLPPSACLLPFPLHYLCQFPKHLIVPPSVSALG